ncbi:MAG TPA: TIGR01906 family membrane protein [Anaerolineales bacterium]|nr:TIGR01906 family membrane protein [Anaerolineales bacterium]
MIDKKWAQTTFQVVLVVLVLIALLLTGVRLLLTNAFVQIEYNMPYFPEDGYGMTKAQRLKWGAVALDYLLNDEGIDFLGDLTFEDGTPLYIERELTHMEDVKVLTGAFLKVWYADVSLLVFFAVLAQRSGRLSAFTQKLSRAGLYTIIALGTLVLFLMLSFNAVFTGFHRIFFEGDSWLFLYSDTLIRLFPLRFWQDAFLFVGVFTLLGGLGLWLGFRSSTQKEKESTESNG